ncbi:uncharacterized protein LOC132543081 [Ylistrum balloti]|uniref:uncharacterized protein LOC132543081 n=1 Tax=Ylistrum balloti TaxID=509963 RepID=UPI002905C9B4|nr:uncharacterized protein LOC132543081 [Ylistrum balloti]
MYIFSKSLPGVRESNCSCCHYRIPKICVPTKTKRQCDSLKVPETCVPLPMTAKGDFGTVTSVDNSNLSTSLGEISPQPDGVGDWPEPELDIEAQGEEDVILSDEDDDGQYKIVIDDTLSTDSGTPEPQHDDVKIEVNPSLGDDNPYQVHQSFSATQTTASVTEDMSSYDHTSCCHNLSSVKDTQHIAQGSKLTSFQNMDIKIKRKPSNECSGQFTYSMSSLELESQLVDQAIDNLLTLPQVFAEVVESKKSQGAAIQLQQLKLVALQKEFEEAEKEMKALRDEISGVSHDVIHTHQSVIESTKQCDALQQDITSYLSICEDVQRTVFYKQEEYDLEKSKIESYQQKIAAYVHMVVEQENQSDTMIELRNLTEDMEILRNKKRDNELNKEEFLKLMDRTSEKQVTDQLMCLDEEMETQRKTAEEKTKLIEDLQEKQRLLEQSILVLHKRNAAQLTRLRRQMKEVHIRRRRWNDQISQLENVVCNLKQQLQK